MTVLIGLFFLAMAELIWIVEPTATIFILIEVICGLMCLALTPLHYALKEKQEKKQ